jgi:hypothetical protein
VNVRPAKGGFEPIDRLKDPSAIEDMKTRSGTCIDDEWTPVARIQLANTIEDRREMICCLPIKKTRLGLDRNLEAAPIRSFNHLILLHPA